MTGHEPNHDTNCEEAGLGWLAFRYVAGELSADEQAAFEARLDTDHPAREAVAREVELAQAVAIAAGSLAPAGASITPAEHEAERSERFTWSMRTAGWLALGAAASLAIGMLLGRGWTNPESLANRSRDAAVQELAGYWQAMETEDESDLALREGPAHADEGLVEVSEDVPGWLLAALEPEEPTDSPRREN